MKKLPQVLYLLIVGVVVVFLGCRPGGDGTEGTADRTEDWIQLFNGRDLDNWVVKFTGYPLGLNLRNTFRVEDGLLRVRYDEWEQWNGEFGHLFYKGEFSHYRLRAEYRFVGEQISGGPGWAVRNNGFMLHSQSPESMELKQDFPASIEVQILGGDGVKPRPTMNLCTPGTNVVIDGELIEQHCVDSRSETFHGEQWVSVEVEVLGGEVIRHFVNGEEVLSYESPQLDPRDKSYAKLLPPDGNKILSKGYIAIQAESHPTDFRKIELLVLE